MADPVNPDTIPQQSLKTLVNASLIAVFMALVMLFAFVLPAEYGIDPTGLGGKLGLIALAKTHPASPTPLDCGSNAQSPTEISTNNRPSQVANLIQPLDESQTIQWQDSANIVIPPRQGLEYKFEMATGATLEFEWQTDGETIHFDFHGEPKGATDGFFQSYLLDKQTESKGKLTVPFEGIHGWYWENETDKPIAIQLSSKGNYRILGVMPQH